MLKFHRFGFSSAEFPVSLELSLQRSTSYFAAACRWDATNKVSRAA
jgi:hypothetical protein